MASTVVAAPTRRRVTPSRARRSSSRRTTARPPVRPTVRLTPEGREALHERLARLRTQVLAPLGIMLGDPEHDRRIDDDYDRAFAEAAQLEQLLAEAEGILPPEDGDVVALGSSVEVRFADGSVEGMRLVHPAEAFLDDERVSVEAPVARALLGHRSGDVVEVVAPAGRMTVTVVAVRQSVLVGG